MGERTIVTPTTQVQRTVMTPKKTVVAKNPSTMKMTTEYAEPYIKRAGYTQRAGFTGATTQVVSKGEVLEMGNAGMQHMQTIVAPTHMGQVTRMTTVAAPAMTTQVTRMQTTAAPTGAALLGRGYTRIDPWK